MLDAQNTKHYLNMRDSMTLMRHMQVELLDLVDKIAFNSITDLKLFDEVKKQLEKIFCILLQERSLRKRHNQAKQKKNHRPK